MKNERTKVSNATFHNCPSSLVGTFLNNHVFFEAKEMVLSLQATENDEEEERVSATFNVQSMVLVQWTSKSSCESRGPEALRGFHSSALACKR